MAAAHDPADRPPVYAASLAAFLRHRLRIVNACEMYAEAPGAVRERLSREAGTLHRVLDGTEYLRMRS